MIHKLKILPKYYKAVFDGRKNFEVRYNDRNYKVGDTLVLQEWDGEYTGRTITETITYILDDAHYLQPNFVVLGIELAPIAEAAPVIYCKDCKYYKYKPLNNVCTRDIESVLSARSKLDYCSLAERREENEAD